MKRLFPLFTFILLTLQLNSQCPNPDAIKPQDGNGISTNILNSGNLFWDGDDPGFIINEDLPIKNSPIFAAALWMGGFDVGGNLKMAAQTYGSASGAIDYFSGPLNDIGLQDEDLCEDYNRIWRVTAEKIQQHKLDFADNGIIDNPLGTIFQWPGKANPHFFDYTGFDLPDMSSEWAPFFDVDNDGIYNPLNGDYPHPPNTNESNIPASMNWTVFNDAGIHTATGGDIMQMEIHLTSWSFNCNASNILNKTVFTSHKMIYQGIEPLDSFHIGMWVDPDLGCSDDDYIGSYPDQNAFYVYESTNENNSDCSGNSYPNYRPPTLSVQFLNQELSKFTYYNNPSVTPPPPPGTTDPFGTYQFNNYLTGSWQDGTPFTYGGDAYNVNNPPFAPHVFPDNPNDINGWSMVGENLPGGDRRVIGTYYHDYITPGEIIQLDIAYSYHRSDDILNHLEIVDHAYDNIDLIKQYYDNGFEDACSLVLNTRPEIENNIELFPNPSAGFINLNTPGLDVLGLSLIDINGRLVWNQNDFIDNYKLLNFSHLSKGVYFLNIITKEGIFPKKVIIQ